MASTVLPDRDTCRATLDAVAVDVRSGGGSAHVLSVAESTEAHFAALFDRSVDYGALLDVVRAARATLSTDNVLEALKQSRKLRKSFAALAAIDFFPGEARGQADAALQEFELAAKISAVGR